MHVTENYFSRLLIHFLWLLIGLLANTQKRRGAAELEHTSNSGRDLFLALNHRLQCIRCNNNLERNVTRGCVRKAALAAIARLVQ